MPIAGSYEWSQKKEQVKIKLPLKGVSPTKVDILGIYTYLTLIKQITLRSYQLYIESKLLSILFGIGSFK